MQTVLSLAASAPAPSLASIQGVFPVVLFAAIILFVVVGVLSMLTRGSNLHDQIGQGGMFLGNGPLDGGMPSEAPLPASAGPAPIEGGERGEREHEIRQMLTARSERLVRRGQAPLDIDAELAKLESIDPHPPGTAGGGDVALANEVRQLVRARNERRERQGLETLDVEAEVQRTLAELNP
jgi:hypothetical protein